MSNRTQRRRAARSSTCSLCFDSMTHHDRQPYRLGEAHPKCVTRQAVAEATQSKAALDQITANAQATMANLAVQQRAQAMGLWTPGAQ